MEKTELEKQYAELSKNVETLRELLTAKFSDDNQSKQADELFKKVIDKLHPPTRKMQWAIPDKDGQVPEGAIYLGQFLKAITPGKNAFVPNDVIAHIKTTMETGTDSLGGYVVPEDFSKTIIKLETDDSIIRRIARIFPMTVPTRNIPRQLTSVTVSWTGEGAAATETNPTFERLIQTAKKMTAIVKLTDELLADNNVGLDKFIMGLVAEAMATEEDRVAFAGDVSGAGDPFNGVLYASGVNTVTMAGANVVFDDVIDLITSLNSKYRKGATLITSTDGLKLLMKLKDQNDNYIWQAPTAPGLKATIWGYAYEISDEIPSNLGGGSDQTAILFGNFKKHYFVSDLGGYEVKSSDSASDVANTQSAFIEDETWFRFKKRVSLDVALPVAFSKLLIK